MKFRADKIAGLLNNEGDAVTKAFQHLAGNIVVAQGFGVPIKNDGFPLRFLAYIVPVLHLLRQLIPRGSNEYHSVTAEFYFATQGVIRASGNSPWWHMGHVCDGAVRMAGVIRDYVARVHPATASHMRVLHDRVIYPGSRAEKLIDQLAQIAEQVASERVRTFAEKRGGTKALRYMVEHVLYMRDPLRRGVNGWREFESQRLVPEMATEFHHLIMVGGPSERVFYDLRQSVCREFNGSDFDPDHYHQFFTPIGDPPTYHLQRGEPVMGNYAYRSRTHERVPLWFRLTQSSEPSHDYSNVMELLARTIRDVSPDMGVRKAVLRDLLVLFNDAGGSDDFRWCGPAATALDKGKTPELPIEVLQRGWDIVRAIQS